MCTVVNDTNDYDDVEPDDTDELSVADPVLGKTRLLSRQCDTCIFGPGNPMGLAAGGLRQLVGETRQRGGFIICHNTLPRYRAGARPAVCRGFADRYVTWQLRLARLLGFLEVEPPTPAGGDSDPESAAPTTT
jgi:hypothetical protein